MRFVVVGGEGGGWVNVVCVGGELRPAVSVLSAAGENRGEGAAG